MVSKAAVLRSLGYVESAEKEWNLGKCYNGESIGESKKWWEYSQFDLNVSILLQFFEMWSFGCVVSSAIFRSVKKFTGNREKISVLFYFMCP